ncbi:MAG: hypothetical protein AUJ92_20265 [Armatimonadetes bacterium CG2_30_59_28]|nr:MFS transporter [Armatimonadota bacterium]OIO89946.1 MAG: hypothetical protein AUJ92_20265 [Armatimonadetes bacterium CG2_30_59_28]PIU66867.1 MAG: hypothetical protein COS85_02975 [Armatimonadetes bacterium CG07_land_8_20_14_0_80_59_28]PIY40183.1 MAG: hypothetical protein COZ05_18055 [Armatimonadetes bacterium CG_4_10_14_3_um_filter_59_10]
MSFIHSLDRAYLDFFRKYPAIALVGLVSFLGEFAFGIVLVMLPLHLVAAFGDQTMVASLRIATVRLITYSVAVFAVTEMALQAPMGHLSDRVGRRSVAMLGIVLSSCAPCTMYFAQAPLLFVIVRVMDGIGSAGLWSSIIALASDLTESRDRATSMSVVNTSRMLGLALGPSTGLCVAHLTGSNRSPFAVSFFLFCVVLIVCALLLPRQSKRGPTDPDASRSKRMETGGLLAWAREAAVTLRQTPALGVMLVTYVALQFGVTLPAPIIPVYAKEFLGFSEREMSLAFLIPAVTVAVISLPLARLADQYGKLRAIKLSLTICTVGMLLVPQFRSLFPVMACIGILAVAYAWGIPSWLGLTSVMVPADRQGLTMGMMNAARGVGFCLGPIVGGEAWVRGGPTAPYYASGLLFAGCLVAILLLLKSPEPGV